MLLMSALKKIGSVFSIFSSFYITLSLRLPLPHTTTIMSDDEQHEHTFEQVCLLLQNLGLLTYDVWLEPRVGQCWGLYDVPYAVLCSSQEWARRHKE